LTAELLAMTDFNPFRHYYTAISVIFRYASGAVSNGIID